jgi:hypothetical protein
MEEKSYNKDSLDQLFDNFNKKISEQFNDILSKIESINSDLRKTVTIKEVNYPSLLASS